MTITEQIVHLSAIQFWLFTLLALAAALAAFYFAFRHLHLARLIENTPTTKIAHAQQGYVELDGTALPTRDGLFEAPLSGVACCWYEYKIARRSGKHWRTLERERSDAPFLLEDASGRCLVDPAGARIDTGRPDVWHGSSRVAKKNARTKAEPNRWGWGLLTREVGFGARYRYTETRIHPGDGLYAIGEFRSHDDLARTRQREARRRELLRAWKRAPQQLLARFDSNRDGRIDLDEWNQAQLAAAAQSGIDQRRSEARREPHRLAQPARAGLPYLISTLPEFTVVKRYKRWALLLLLGALLSGSAVVLLLGARLSG